MCCLVIPRRGAVFFLRGVEGPLLPGSLTGWRVGAVPLSAPLPAPPPPSPPPPPPPAGTEEAMSRKETSARPQLRRGIIQDTLKQLQPHINQYALG